ncbi:MAG: hypothetical protein ABW166_04990 [Sedimenticola sp.]
MGNFKKLDQELQELTIAKLKNWKKTDKFTIGLKLEDFHNNSFIDWLKSEGHTVIGECLWLTINGVRIKDELAVADVFLFLLRTFEDHENENKTQH